MLPMDKARYRAHAVAVAFGLSSKGNTQIAVTFEIVDHAELAGETIAWIGHFTDATSARTIESLIYCGWQGDDLAELGSLDEAGVRAAMPDAVDLVCEPEEYEGAWHLRVQWVNRAGGRFAFKEKVEGNDLRAFAAQMRSNVQSVRASSGAPRQRQAAAPTSTQQRQTTSQQSWSGGQRNGGARQPHPNAPGNNDDIPF